MPKTYSRRHFLQIVWLSIQTALLAFGLHGAFYALFWFAIPIFQTGDEPVFFIILLFVVPTGFALGLVKRIWDWSVVQPIREMSARGFEMPERLRYFTPFASYAWLWKFSRGTELISDRRIPASVAFAAVFLLGVVGFFIIRAATQYRLGTKLAHTTA
jgi:hypothetical protein